MKDWSNWQEEWKDMDGGSQDFSASGKGLHPGIKSALIVTGVVLTISVINAFTGGTSIIFCYPIQLVIYAGNGALAAYFAQNVGYTPESLPRVGALAGTIAWILPAVFYIVGSLVLGMFTFGLGFLGIAMWLLCGPIDLAIHILCAMAGAWLYGRSNRNTIPSDQW